MMSRRLGAVEQICMDTVEDIRDAHKLLVDGQIVWAEYERRRERIKAKALDTISVFLGIIDEEENNIKEV